jgi:hypothetical protein
MADFWTRSWKDLGAGETVRKDRDPVKRVASNTAVHCRRPSLLGMFPTYICIREDLERTNEPLGTGIIEIDRSTHVRTHICTKQEAGNAGGLL